MFITTTITTTCITASASGGKFKLYFNLIVMSVLLCCKSLQAAYISKDDNLLHISSVYIQPFTDNMNQIYASKAEELIKNQIQQEHQWDLTDEQKKADLIQEKREDEEAKAIAHKENTNLDEIGVEVFRRKDT